MAARRQHPLLRAARRPMLRSAPVTVSAPRPSRRQAVALLGVLVLVAGGITAVSYLVRPDRARAFTLVHGSVFLSDSVAPVAVDLASGRPTVRLVQAARQVGARTTADLAVTPLRDTTLLLDRRTGEFNMVAPTGFVVKTTGGVPIAALRGSTGTVGIASGDQAYLEQTGPTGTRVYLIGQSTVQSAGQADSAGQNARVRPRAVRSMPEPASTAPGSSAAVDGDLWLLVGSGDTRTVRRLHLPGNSSPGVTLASSDHGSVPAVSALEATGTATVGVASAGAIRLVDGSSVRAVRFAAVDGANSVMAASDATDRLSFLIHGTGGWYAVSVGADGSDVHPPTKLGGIAPDADLAPPAMSEGAMYTVDRSSGRAYRIDATGRSTAQPRYPLVRQHGKVIEAGGFGDSYVIARGARVIVNSPGHLDALVLFTDGSRDPLTIEKSSAVSVNASSGADALTRSRHADSKNRTPRRSTPKQRPVAPVDNAVDCRNTRQQPHIPGIVGAVPGSRSVALSWTYPTPDPQDCLPSTYVVSATTTGDDAPSPPGPLRVQGQSSVNLAGLFPSTRYQVTVTAYLNGRGTSSAPRVVTTGPAGPAAPTDVVAVPDDADNWNVTWHSCGTVAHGCVPSANWTVVPELCDGRGLSGAPSPITVAADPSSVVQPPAQLAGGDALLGRGVRFQVEGVGVDDAVGAPSAFTPCTYSWASPDAAGITVSASTPPTTGAERTAATTATVRFADGAVHDLGGVDGTLTYALLDAQGDVVTTRGPTTDTSANLGGIVPGEQYSVRVTAAPPRHLDSAVTLEPVAVEPARASWPTPAVTAVFAARTGHLLDGTLSVSFDLPGVDTLHGETFDLTAGSRLVCGRTSQSLDGRDVAVDQPMTFDVNRIQLNGACRVDLALEQDPSSVASPPLFGSGNSPQASTPVHIDPPLITATQGDFSARWDGGYDDPQITTNYQGLDQLTLLANRWHITASNGSSPDCGSAGNGPNTTVDVTPTCVSAGGPFTVSIGYTYLGQDENYTVSVQGSPPDPVTTDELGFSAVWGVDATDPDVELTYTGSADRSDLQQLTWTETVTSNDTRCGSVTRNPGNGDPDVPVDYSICPVTDANGELNPFVVTVTFADPTYGGSGTYQTAIDGSPPQ